MSDPGGTGAGHRGALRIFLGAAPGVGKTYAMLNEGRRLKAAGHDVVIGYLESHGRRETEVQAGDLQNIPRACVTHRGVTIEEMDTDAIIARRPEIALIDELAHTNAPGSRRVKRYLDVELIRNHGISVISTLNVQHLEGLNDAVAGLTGVHVRETIPDQVLEEATEVQLIDLPAALLIERLHQGKIYPPDRVPRALDNFFQTGNITALRELALRFTAGQMDERLASLMYGDTPVETTDRVAVLVDERAEGPDAYGQTLRAAWRIASALETPLLVCLIDAARDATAGEQAAESPASQLAADLGAEVHPLAVPFGAEIIEPLAEVLTAARVTLLVLGHPVRRGLWARLRPSLADRLMERIEGLDCLLVRIDSGGS